MKDRLQKPFMVLALVVSIILTLAPIGIANAQGPLISTQSGGRAGSPLDKVDHFIAALAKAGFTTEEGTVEYIDLVKECCQRVVQDTLANNSWPNAYVTLNFTQNIPDLPRWLW